MIVEQLRSQTKQAHLELDHSLYPHIQNIRDEEAYAKLLKAFYGFFKPMQEQFDLFLNDHLVPDYQNRRKPEWILQDLEKLKQATTELAFFTGIPAIKTSAEALGAFYVLEGSTMGGSIISKKIRENLGYKDDSRLRFFAGYGENNRVLWNNFLETLEKTKENPDEIIDSAQNTFITFKGWLDQVYARE